MRISILAIVSLLYAVSNLSAQVFLKAGIGLTISETYKNNYTIQNQEFLYGQSTNYNLGVGFRKARYETTLQVDYFEQEHDINIEMFDLQVDGLRFTTPAFSTGLSMQYKLQKYISLQAGIGVLSTKSWDLKSELENEIISIPSQIIYRKRSIIPLALVGIAGKMKLTSNIELEALLQLRAGLRPLNSSFSFVLEKVTDNFSLLYENFLYIDHGNSAHLNINLIYYL